MVEREIKFEEYEPRNRKNWSERKLILEEKKSQRNRKIFWEKIECMRVEISNRPEVRKY